MRKYLPFIFALAAPVVAVAVCSKASRADLGFVGKQVQVPEMNVKGLSSSPGMVLNVYYVSAREAALDFWHQTLKVHEIEKGPVAIPIDSTGTAIVPPVTLNLMGLRIYNYVVFVVTRPKDGSYFLRNLDGSVPLVAQGWNDDSPEPLPAGPMAQAVFTGYIDAETLDQMTQAGPNGAKSIQLNAIQDLWQ